MPSRGTLQGRIDQERGEEGVRGDRVVVERGVVQGFSQGMSKVFEQDAVTLRAVLLLAQQAATHTAPQGVKQSRRKRLQPEAVSTGRHCATRAHTPSFSSSGICAAQRGCQKSLPSS